MHSLARVRIPRINRCTSTHLVIFEHTRYSWSRTTRLARSSIHEYTLLVPYTSPPRRHSSKASFNRNVSAQFMPNFPIYKKGHLNVPCVRLHTIHLRLNTATVTATVLHQLHAVYLLHNDRGGAAAAIAYRRNTELAILQLIQQTGEDAAAGAAEGMAK